MSRLVVATVVAIFAVPASSYAQSVLTEAEFLSVLDDGHPAVVVRREGLELARADAVAARALRDPDLELSREAPSGAVEQLDIALAWQLPDPSRGPAVRSAERIAEAREAGFAEDRLLLRVELRRAFAAWAVTSERSRVMSAHAERLVELAARERARAQRGESSALEARRLELAAQEARTSLALAQAATTAAAATARAWQPDLDPELVPLLPPLPPLPSSTADVEAHPRLIALAEELEAARLARQAAGRIVASPRLAAGWQRQETDVASFDGPIVALTWPLPLLDRKRAQRAEADARLRASEARLETGRRQLESECAGALAAYERLVTASREMAALPERGPLVEAALAAFRLGETSLTDLLDTLRAAVDADHTDLDLRAAALAAHRELERLTGSPLPLDAGEAVSQPLRDDEERILYPYPQWGDPEGGSLRKEHALSRELP